MKSHYIILGAGISGLSLAWFLRQRFGDEISISILEKKAQPGGWIRSNRCQGFLFESGPRSCRSKGNGLVTLQLIESLGLQEEVIAASSAAQKRYLYIDQCLQQVPAGLFSFLKSPLTWGLIPALYKEWRSNQNYFEDESIYNFISRGLNNDIAEKFFDPITLGIYAGDIRQLSMQACFPDFYNQVHKHGSILRAIGAKLFQRKTKNFLSPFVKEMTKKPIFTLKNGMETLIKALAHQLRHALQFNCDVRSLSLKNGKIEVETDDGQVLSADHVFSALSSSAFAALIPKVISVPYVPTASIAIVNMGWKENVLNRQGFGYLVPSKEKEDVLGVVWDSSAFPEQNNYAEETRLTVMLGGTHRPDIPLMQENEIVAYAKQAISKHLGIVKQPDALKVSIAANAIPQYPVGHVNRVEQFKMRVNSVFDGRLHFLGNSWYGVSVNDCIASGKEMAGEPLNLNLDLDLSSRTSL